MVELVLCICLALVSQATAFAGQNADIPRGALQGLIVEHQGRVYEFGPFVGYFFWPEESADLSRLSFACRNEGQFYTKDLPEDAILFTGQARFVCLPGDAPYRPENGRRMRPVFPDEIPRKWLDTRPSPQDEYLHFHSCYNAQGPVACGFWLRHEARKVFTYDMGGRVGPDSVLYHQVQPGVDTGFPLLVEFDRGPGGH
mgnify:CR=1 FL=1